ncbi:MAG: aldehyde dehydrogenase family protein [Actinomycetales bacterium]
MSAVATTVSLAQIAQQTWWGATPQARAEILEAIATELDAQAEELATIADRETHLGMPRLVGEVARTTFQLRMFATALREGSILAPRTDEAVAGPPPQGHPTLQRTYVPIGVVAVFGASNFPFAFGVLGGDTASALAAGCAVIVKEHPAHPELSRRLVELARKVIATTGAPIDLLTSITGMREGAALVAANAVRAVGFTGSLAGGRALYDIAANRPVPIPFYGELGSLNPVVVTPAAATARAAQIAKGFVESMTLGAGQFCTKPAVLIVPKDSGIAEAALALLPDLDAMTLLTTDIAARFDAGITALAATPEVTVHRPQPALGDQQTPAIITADLTTFLDPTSPLRHEYFGPSSVVLTYESPAEALQVLQLDEGVLVGCVHGEVDDPDAPTFLRALEHRAGRIVWNGWPTGVAVTPEQMHGGPYPAATFSTTTSVGLHAAQRFARPVVRQDWPAHHSNPAAITDRSE